MNWLRTDKKRWKFISGYLKRVFDRFTTKEKCLKNPKICGNKTGQFRQFYCRVVKISSRTRNTMLSRKERKKWKQRERGVYIIGARKVSRLGFNSCYHWPEWRKRRGRPSRARAREEAMEREKKWRREIESRAVWWQRPWLCRCISITRLMTPWPLSRPSRISELRNLHTPTCAFPRLEKRIKKYSILPLAHCSNLSRDKKEEAEHGWKL